MTTLKATVKGRRLELDVPADWPDGTEVEIHRLEANGEPDVVSPDEIAKTLAAMDRVEPLDLSDAEEAAWQAELQASKERDKAEFAEHAEKLRRMWE